MSPSPYQQLSCLPPTSSPFHCKRGPFSVLQIPFPHTHLGILLHFFAVSQSFIFSICLLCILSLDISRTAIAQDSEIFIFSPRSSNGALLTHMHKQRSYSLIIWVTKRRGCLLSWPFPSLRLGLSIPGNSKWSKQWIVSQKNWTGTGAMGVREKHTEQSYQWGDYGTKAKGWQSFYYH